MYYNLSVFPSSVGIYSKGQVEIIPNDLGNRITPSYVAFTPEGRLVGDAAKNQLTANPVNTVFDVKRLMGRTWDDPSVQKDIKNYPFKVVNSNNRPAIEVSANWVFFQLVVVMVVVTAFSRTRRFGVKV